MVFVWHEQQPVLQALSLEICVQSCTADSNGRLSVLTISFPIYLGGSFLRVCSTWCLTSANVLGLFSGGAGGFGSSADRRPKDWCVGPRVFSILALYH